MLLVLASVVFLGSESLGTRDHILLYQIWDFPFRRLLRLAGSRWRYSTPPSYGCCLVKRLECLKSLHGSLYKLLRIHGNPSKWFVVTKTCLLKRRLLSNRDSIVDCVISRMCLTKRRLVMYCSNLSRKRVLTIRCLAMNYSVKIRYKFYLFYSWLWHSEERRELKCSPVW
jgi:hypothetical protein